MLEDAKIKPDVSYDNEAVEAGGIGSSTCPGCGAPSKYAFFAAQKLPTNVGSFYETAAKAQTAPTASVSLHYCSRCGLVHNHAYDKTEEIFKPGYEVSLHHSKTFAAFIESVANRLVSQFDLQGKKITEIGCGDAYFLNTLAERGGNTCFGMDPTIASEGTRRVGEGSVTLTRSYFSDRHTDHKTDFICCLSVFEDIPLLQGFLKNLHKLANRNNAPVYFEVFNGWRAFEQGEVWSVHYEQCNYFSLKSLEKVFRKNGFRIENSGTCYQGDQYLFVEAFAEPIAADTGQSNTADDEDTPAALKAFNDMFEERRTVWEEYFTTCRRENQKVVLWGTGGKGITFLNSVRGSEIIEVVAEINPDKHGKHMPVTGQKIVPPEALRDLQPDIIIITNPIYKQEMIKTAKQLGVNAGFLVA